MITVAWDCIGLRDSLGRFASLNDETYMADVREEMESARGLVETVFRIFAPYDAQHEGEHFRDTLNAEVGEGGALLSVTTTNAKLRNILKYGSKPHAINAAYDEHGYTGVLHWITGGVDHFARYVFHPGTAPNDWEDRAAGAVDEIVIEVGRNIADRVRRRIML